MRYLVDWLMRYLWRGHSGVLFNARCLLLYPSRFKMQIWHLLPTVGLTVLSIHLRRNSDYFCVRH